MPGILLPEFYIVLALLAVFTFIALQSRSLDKKGLIVGILVGLISYYLGGIESFFILLVFFLVGESATRWAREKGNSKEHEVRGISNVLGNAGPGLILLALHPVGMSIGFFAVVSGALGDTLSGEIGRLSKKQPRMITTLQLAERGTDGAVTLLGLGASIFGGIVIGIFYFAVTRNGYLSALVIFAGFLGGVVDSILGASLQQWELLNNDQVNFLAMLITGILITIMAF